MSPQTGSIRTESPAGPRDRLGRRWPRRLGPVVLVVLALLVVGWLVLSCPVLAVRGVQVQGVARLTPGQVLTVADVTRGTALARVDVDGVRRRVAALAAVQSVQVTRAWPATLRIRVTERTAVAAVPAPDATWRLVDDTGLPFASEMSQPAGLPRLIVDAPGSRDPATRAAVQVISQLSSGLRGQLVSVAAPGPNSVTLTLLNGRTVIWGGPGGTSTKIAAVTALLPRPEKTIDVTSPTVVVVH